MASRAHTTLQPRQPITASPYALNALSVRAGSVGSAEIDNQAVQQRISGSCEGVFRGSIQSINADGSGWDLASNMDPAVPARFVQCSHERAPREPPC
jgi:hypothetical protein